MKQGEFPLLPYEIVSWDLERVSREVGDALRAIFRRSWPEKHYYSFKERLSEFMSSRSVSIEDISFCWLGSASEGEVIGDLEVNFFFAKLYHLSAIKAFDDRPEKVLTFLVYAVYQLGFFDGYQDFVKKAEIFIKGPSSGGQANREIRERTCEYLSELLASPPEGGWGKIPDTAEKLTEKIDNFIRDKGFGKVIPDSENFIVSAIKGKGKGKARAIYLENLFKK